MLAVRGVRDCIVFGVPDPLLGTREGDLREDTLVHGMGLDSIHVMQLCAYIEESFNAELNSSVHALLPAGVTLRGFSELVHGSLGEPI